MFEPALRASHMHMLADRRAQAHGLDQIEIQRPALPARSKNRRIFSRAQHEASVVPVRATAGLRLLSTALTGDRFLEVVRSH
jgi:hypothetical protein